MLRVTWPDSHMGLACTCKPLQAQDHLRTSQDCGRAGISGSDTQVGHWRPWLMQPLNGVSAPSALAPQAGPTSTDDTVHAQSRMPSCTSEGCWYRSILLADLNLSPEPQDRVHL